MIYTIAKTSSKGWSASNARAMWCTKKEIDMGWDLGRGRSIILRASRNLPTTTTVFYRPQTTTPQREETSSNLSNQRAPPSILPTSRPPATICLTLCAQLAPQSLQGDPKRSIWPNLINTRPNTCSNRTKPAWNSQKCSDPTNQPLWFIMAAEVRTNIKFLPPITPFQCLRIKQPKLGEILECSIFSSP